MTKESKRLIINSPYTEPKHYWRNYESSTNAKLMEGRRGAGYFIIEQAKGGLFRRSAWECSYWSITTCVVWVLLFVFAIVLSL